MKSINTQKIKEMEIKENNYYVIIDFGKTITSKKSLDSWMAVADFEIYEEKCKNTQNQLYIQ